MRLETLPLRPRPQHGGRRNTGPQPPNVPTAGAAVGIARLLHVCVGLRSGWVFDPLLRRARRQ